MDSGLLAEKIEDVLYSAIPFLDESNPDKVIDMAITFGLQLLATLVLFLIIRFKFWNVITGMMEKRKASVEEAISAKDEALIELENAKKDAEELKGNSKKEAQMIIDEAKKSSVVEANAIIEEANQKIQDESARAREQIEKEHQEMQDRIGPLIARPSSLLLGAAAQLGIFSAFLLALALGFPSAVAAAIAIIGGADGPTSILVASRLAADYLPAIAIAAYSYMALIPLIQPPIMRLLTTRKEREIKMEQLRPVSKTEKIIFPIAVATVVILLIPDTAPLIGMLMLGNLLRECGLTDRLSDTAQNALCNIVTIFLGLSVGCKAIASTFLTWDTIKIIILGLLAFIFSTVGGLVFGKIMCKLTGGKVNPLIGSAGVSAVPMAARVSQVEGQKANPVNFLLMHAMGPNVAGVIGSAVAAGFMLKVFGA